MPVAILQEDTFEKIESAVDEVVDDAERAGMIVVGAVVVPATDATGKITQYIATVTYIPDGDEDEEEEEPS